ncbi:hypothetical protein [Leucobacter japonicus]|uniref:hypothetical protein n=1 Tax=Leucobacter japonicus TaxID=1461259 RepID=UPI0006A7D86F|nr:hypothetical protein [Leucobacter japonicus]
MSVAADRTRELAAPLPHAGWVAELPDGAVYASLYSAPEAARDEAAARFVGAGLPMHLDVIIGRDERHGLVHLGIVPELIVALGERYPDALLEVHVIVLAATVRDDDVRDEIGRLLVCASQGGVQRVALPTPYAADLELSSAFRTAGGEIWSVVNPADEFEAQRHVDSNAGATGTLVMLIEPGTRQSARPELLTRVSDLAPSTRVSVDGGVDAGLAARALALGAHHVVVGRALLGPSHPEAFPSVSPQGEAS